MFLCVCVFSRQIHVGLYSSVCVCLCVQPSSSCGTLLKCLCVFVCSAVKFLWDCCAESVSLLKNDDGTGCILAHCMGLGKTLSVSVITINNNDCFIIVENTSYAVHCILQRLFKMIHFENICIR